MGVTWQWTSPSRRTGLASSRRWSWCPAYTPTSRQCTSPSPSPLVLLLVYCSDRNSSPLCEDCCVLLVVWDASGQSLHQPEMRPEVAVWWAHLAADVAVSAAGLTGAGFWLIQAQAWDVIVCRSSGGMSPSGSGADRLGFHLSSQFPSRAWYSSLRSADHHVLGPEPWSAYVAQWNPAFRTILSRKQIEQKQFWKGMDLGGGAFTWKHEQSGCWKSSLNRGWSLIRMSFH